MRMHPDSRIFLAGHRGLVGSALLRRLKADGYSNVITRTRADCDLRDPGAVDRLFRDQRPEHVVLAAAKVGGIMANARQPVEFLKDNLEIELNVIRAAHEWDVNRLLFLGSSCIYPKHAPQPMKEEHLFTGPLEPTNQWYAMAKITGVMLVRAYRRQFDREFFSAMPTNLYGPGDNFDLETSHVLPALIRKTHEAKHSGRETVEVWGTGSPRREFMHVDDLANACLFLMNHPDPPELVNVGVGEDISIKELAELIAEVVGYEGTFSYDTSKPDGTPRKLLDTAVMEGEGWTATIGLREGIEETYEWFLAQDAQPQAV